MKSPDEREFHFNRPTIFSDVEWLRYGEGRRIPEITDTLTGNATASPTILENAYTFTSSTLEKSKWIEREQQRAMSRLEYMRRQLGLSAIGYPKPAHGTELINLDLTMSSTSTFHPESRHLADATITKTGGFGNVFTPADCPIINVVDTHARAIAQIHAGYMGLSKGIIPSALAELRDQYDFSPNESLVYVSSFPHHNFEVYGPVLEQLAASPYTQDHLANKKSLVELNMAETVLDQLTSADIKEEHIELSQDDSFTDPTLYSQRMWQQKKTNGRNPVILGIARHSRSHA